MKKTLAILSSIVLMSGVQAFAADASTAPAATTGTPLPRVIAVVNVQQIFQQSPKIADLNKKLQGQFKSRQDKLLGEQKILQDEIDQFKKESPTMSQKDKDSAQKKIVDDQANLSKEATTFQQDLSKEQSRIMKGVISDLNTIIAGIAKKNSYNLVLDAQAVVYATDGADITKQVADQFNK